MFHVKILCSNKSYYSQFLQTYSDCHKSYVQLTSFTCLGFYRMGILLCSRHCFLCLMLPYGDITVFKTLLSLSYVTVWGYYCVQDIAFFVLCYRMGILLCSKHCFLCLMLLYGDITVFKTLLSLCSLCNKIIRSYFNSDMSI